jgi:hypothetical protein
MRKPILFDKFKKLYNGNTVKKNGKWSWESPEGTTHVISNAWLLMMVRKAKDVPKEETTVEIQQHQDKVMVKNVGIETPVEKQKPENEPSASSEEEIKRLKNQKRREQRAKRKLEQQKKKDEKPE